MFQNTSIMDKKITKLKTVRIQNIKNYNRSPLEFPVPDNGDRTKNAREKVISCLRKLNALTGRLQIFSDAWKVTNGPHIIIKGL
jgi:hypothetical protein